mmetsp:Transcript_41827/g.94467  ORF Transcript_41827/g.94467 Transcript_41827/m.94467 type:complete len:233 (-) Transcript_41827:426-1124(-)
MGVCGFSGLVLSSGVDAPNHRERRSTASAHRRRLVCFGQRGGAGQRASERAVIYCDSTISSSGAGDTFVIARWPVLIPIRAETLILGGFGFSPLVIMSRSSCPSRPEPSMSNARNCLMNGRTLPSSTTPNTMSIPSTNSSSVRPKPSRSRFGRSAMAVLRSCLSSCGVSLRLSCSTLASSALRSSLSSSIAPMRSPSTLTDNTIWKMQNHLPAFVLIGISPYPTVVAVTRQW